MYAFDASCLSAANLTLTMIQVVAPLSVVLTILQGKTSQIVLNHSVLRCVYYEVYF